MRIMFNCIILCYLMFKLSNSYDLPSILCTKSNFTPILSSPLWPQVLLSPSCSDRNQSCVLSVWYQLKRGGTSKCHWLAITINDLLPVYPPELGVRASGCCDFF